MKKKTRMIDLAMRAYDDIGDKEMQEECDFLASITGNPDKIESELRKMFGIYAKAAIIQASLFRTTRNIEAQQAMLAITARAALDPSMEI